MMFLKLERFGARPHSLASICAQGSADPQAEVSTGKEAENVKKVHKGQILLWDTVYHACMHHGVVSRP